MCKLRFILPAMALFLATLMLPAQELRFQHMAALDGRGGNSTYCLFPASSGLVWIGTARGVYVYDGATLRHITGTRGDIAAITGDGTGTIWAATKDHGLLRIAENGHQVDILCHVEGDRRSIADNGLTAVYDLDDTTLLIGSRRHSLIFLDKRTLAFSYWTDSLSIAPSHASPRPPAEDGWCHAITRLDSGRIWLGFLNRNMTMVADARHGAVRHQLRIVRAGSVSQTCALLVNGILYTGGWQRGIDMVDLRVLPSHPSRMDPSPRTIGLPDEVVGLAYWQGHIVAATRKSGLFVIDPDGKVLRNIRHSRQDQASLSSDRIQCLVADDRGALWAGTANDLDLHVPDIWTTRVRALFPAQMDTQPDLLFHRLEQRADGALRVYTSEGFFLVDSALQHVDHTPVLSRGIPLEPTVRATGRDGTTWLGTEHGLVTYAEDQDGHGPGILVRDVILENYPPGSMYQIRGLWPDTLAGRPVLVIGALGFGVKVFDAATGLELGRAMPPEALGTIARSMVHAMVHLEDGTYWVATADGAFKWWSGDRVVNPTFRGGGVEGDQGIVMPGSDVRGLIWSKGVLWGITHDGILFSMSGDSVARHVPPAEVRTTMNGFTADREGRLWVTTDNGLLLFDPAEGTFIRIPVNDGTRFTKLSPAITAMADGRIAFCADNALLLLDPGPYRHLPAVPAPYLADLTVGGFPVPWDRREVQASYRASLVELAFSAVGHGFPQAPQFEYRMEGVEQDWRVCHAGSMVRYAALTTGTYRLLARVCDPFGRIGPERTVLRLHIKGPLWQRWWFYAAGLVLMGAGLFALYRFRLAQAMKLQSVRNRIASDLHDEIGSSLSSITIGSQLAARLNAQGDAGGNRQVGNLLERIGETSSESLRSMSDIVWAIDPKNDQGEALVKRLHRIAEDLLRRKGIQVDFNVGPGVDGLRLPMNARKEILLIGKEAMHNASRHSGASTVRVALQCRNGRLGLCVEDDGRGFNPALHPDGHGLGGMHQRAKAIGASFSLTSIPGQGTRICIGLDLANIRD